MPKKLLPVIYDLLASYLLGHLLVIWYNLPALGTVHFFVNGRVYRKVYLAEDVSQQRW